MAHPAPNFDHPHLTARKGETAIIILDMQNYFSGMAKPLVPELRKLISFCQQGGIPVCLTQHGHRNIEKDGRSLGRWWGKKSGDYIAYGTHDWELLEDFYVPPAGKVAKQAQEGCYDDKDGVALVTDKTTYDAFQDTLLLPYLRTKGIRTVVIGGVMTNLCCETTARSAFVKDFDVIFLLDGNATAAPEMHRATLLNLSYGFARLLSCDQVIAQLSR